MDKQMCGAIIQTEHGPQRCSNPATTVSGGPDLQALPLCKGCVPKRPEPAPELHLCEGCVPKRPEDPAPEFAGLFGDRNLGKELTMDRQMCEVYIQTEHGPQRCSNPATTASGGPDLQVLHSSRARRPQGRRRCEGCTPKRPKEEAPELNGFVGDRGLSIYHDVFIELSKLRQHEDNLNMAEAIEASAHRLWQGMHRYEFEPSHLYCDNALVTLSLAEWHNADAHEYPDDTWPRWCVNCGHGQADGNMPCRWLVYELP